MADVYNDPEHYPKILELGEIESIINLFLKDYKTVQKDYIQNVKAGDMDSANKDLTSLDGINNYLLQFLNLAQITMEKVYPLGIQTQHDIPEYYFLPQVVSGYQQNSHLERSSSFAFRH